MLNSSGLLNLTFNIFRMFFMVIEKLYLVEVQKVSGNLERKICAVGLVKILTECPLLLSTNENQRIW